MYSTSQVLFHSETIGAYIVYPWFAEIDAYFTVRQVVDGKNNNHTFFFVLQNQ